MTASRGTAWRPPRELGPVDPLSGLADRDFFDALLAAALADPAVHETVGLIVLEIDQFAALHELQGHAGWDAVLLAAVQRVREHVRDAGVIARTGVNEIAIVVTDAPDSTTVAALAERLRVALAATRLRAGSLRLRSRPPSASRTRRRAAPSPSASRRSPTRACPLRAAGRNRVTSIAIDVAATRPQGMPIAK